MDHDLIAGYQLLVAKQRQELANLQEENAKLKNYVIKTVGYLPNEITAKRRLSQEEINDMLNNIDKQYAKLENKYDQY